MLVSLKGQGVLIVGASSGIGRETAVLFAREGANVTASARREDRLRSLQHDLTEEGFPIEIASADASNAAEMEKLAALMLRLTALALDLEEHFFDDKIDRHITAMRLNFYPEQTSAPRPGQLRAGAHTDYGVFTILNGESVPGGLEVLAKNGDWIAVETDPKTFVVNIGDLLMRWTNDRWVSNTHRVGNPPASVASRAKRLSIAFFQQPNYDALIECICPPGKAKHPSVRSGEYRDLKYRQTTVAVA